MIVLIHGVMVVILGLLVLIGGVMPAASKTSLYELRRRKQAGDTAATVNLRQRQLLPDVLSLQRIVESLLLVVFVAVSIAGYGWMLGVLISVLAAIVYVVLGRIKIIQRYAQKIYCRYEPILLDMIEKHSRLHKLIRRRTPLLATDAPLASRDELVHMIVQSQSILSSDEKAMITHGMGFSTRCVDEIMTSRARIDSIDKKELLGPLVLHDLHSTGHRSFPVTDGDIDHIIGILDVQTMLNLDSKRSVTAERAMEVSVCYVTVDQILPQALADLLAARQQLAVVVDSTQKTIGLVSLTDVIEALLGHPPKRNGSLSGDVSVARAPKR